MMETLLLVLVGCILAFNNFVLEKMSHRVINACAVFLFLLYMTTFIYLTYLTFKNRKNLNTKAVYDKYGDAFYSGVDFSTTWGPFNIVIFALRRFMFAFCVVQLRGG